MVNLRSVRDLEQKTGWDIDPLRFRANINYDGGAAWNEWDWVGKRVRCGSAILEIIEPTIRCPSTQVRRNSWVLANQLEASSSRSLFMAVIADACRVCRSTPAVQCGISTSLAS